MKTSLWKVYPQRWWIVIAFSLLSCFQSAIWITYSVVATPSIDLFQTSSFMINFLLALGSIVFIPLVFFIPFLLKKGLRVAVILGSVIVLIGCILRCFARTPHTFWLIVLGQALNAAVGPIVMALPPKISAVWFPVDERTTATAITGFSNSVGSVIGFAYGFFVHTSEHIIILTYIQTLCCLILCIVVIIYFPERPPSFPSESSSLEKPPTSILNSIVHLLLNKDFILLSFVGGLSSGIFAAWSALLDVILSPLGYSQEQAAWLGFSATLAGIIAGILVGRFSDSYSRHIKLFLIVFFLFVFNSPRMVHCSS